MSNYRNKKLLEAVREFPCAMCGREDGTVCAAHSNQQRDGKGTGIKAHDYRIASLCYQCHDEFYPQKSRPSLRHRSASDTTCSSDRPQQ